MKKILVVSLTIWALTFSQIQQGFAQSIYFDDSDANIMVLGNAYYEIGFRKSNGAIAYITDKATGQHVTEGSRYECLWGAYRDGVGYIGGCSYNATWPNRFNYSWSATTNSLSLNYTPDPETTRQATAQVIVTASTSHWFDMRLQLQSNWGDVLDYVLFPSDVVFREADIQEALVPFLPGVVFEPAFFGQNRSYIAKYPGDLFADYVALSSVKGQIAIYSLYDQGPIRPLFLGFNHDDAYISDSTYYYHTFAAKVNNGDSWISPRVRIRISQSPVDTINAYRLDNGIDQFLSLSEKLEARYSQVVQSPLFKADAVQLGIPFSQYSALLSHVPAPGILHTVAFQPRGFDENYPDFLPPASSWGTTADMAMMFEQAQAMHFLVMPYTNPTWWDDESPTLQNLPPTLTITDVVLFDNPSVPRYEYYGSHGGYVVSPYSPFVRQRLSQLILSMVYTIPSDVIFEDQIGARPWLFDHNTFSPSPTAYSQGWLEHTRAYSNTLLMTEKGFDRLAETEVGFHGSLLLSERKGETVSLWGTGTWHPYPLAPLMMRDKVLFYQHDLAPETFTTDKATLSWNLAFGYMLSYDLVQSSYGGGVNSQWINLVGDFQKYVISRYADERLTDFTKLQNKVTRTFFEHCAVIANWDESNSYNAGQYVLPPLGTMITKNDGSIVAGIFTTYNNMPLGNGEHYLIEERGSNIVVRQPMGENTNLIIRLLPNWSMTDQIAVWAFAKNGQSIGSVPASITANGVTFSYQKQVAGQSVAYYMVFKPNMVFIPIALK